MNRKKLKNISIKNINRYRKRDRMTLIIGAKCEEGIVLVGDTKVVDTARNVHTHENKIISPLNIPIIVGASGITNLFRQFNRRIPIIIEQRTREYRIKNEEALARVGRSISQFENIQAEQQPVQNNRELKDPPHQDASQEGPIKPPYLYTGEHFLQDCKMIINEIGQEGKNYHPNPLEVLLSFNVGQPVLFHIDCNGFESEIADVISIGSGSVYVDLFFKRLWKSKKLMDTIALASFVIKFVETMKLDNFVGVEKDKLPQVMVILKNGKYGPLDFSNKSTLLGDIQTKVEKIEKQIKDMNFIPLELEECFSIE